MLLRRSILLLLKNGGNIDFKNCSPQLKNTFGVKNVAHHIFFLQTFGYMLQFGLSNLPSILFLISVVVVHNSFKGRSLDQVVLSIENDIKMTSMIAAYLTSLEAFSSQIKSLFFYVTVLKTSMSDISQTIFYNLMIIL